MISRDENGKFAKGNGGGPGRPKKERELDFYRILITTVSINDWQDIIKRAISDAKKGDAPARKWLADYYAGPPVERKEITGADNQPLVIKVVYDELESEE